MFVVNPLTNARIDRNQIQAIDVESIVIFLEEIVIQDTIYDEGLNVAVELGLISGGVPVAEHGNDLLARV